MPRAGDAHLKGGLPVSHDPTKRISYQGTLQPVDFLAQWTKLVQNILLDVIKTLTGVDLRSWEHFLGSLHFGTGIDLPSLPVSINQIGDIMNGLIVVPINDAVAHVNDWWHDITTQVDDAGDKVRDGFAAIFNQWFGVTTATGTTTEVSDAMASIKTTITGGWTIELLTTSGTWTRPVPTDQILEFWVDGFSSGSGAGRGDAGLGFRPGGVHGVGGRFYSKQIVNPSDIPSTVAYTVPAGGAPTNAVNPTDTRADASFGSLWSTSEILTASIASMSGLISATDSKPADGGDGGYVDTALGTNGDAGHPAALGVLGGAGGGGNNAGAGGAGSAGGNANLVTANIAGGAGGGGGGGGLPIGGVGGNGGFPGGGAGGAGACAGTANAADGGYGGNAVIRLRYRLVAS